MSRDEAEEIVWRIVKRVEKIAEERLAASFMSNREAAHRRLLALDRDEDDVVDELVEAILGGGTGANSPDRR